MDALAFKAPPPIAGKCALADQQTGCPATFPTKRRISNMPTIELNFASVVRASLCLLAAACAAPSDTSQVDRMESAEARAVLKRLEGTYDGYLSRGSSSARGTEAARLIVGERIRLIVPGVGDNELHLMEATPAEGFPISDRFKSLVFEGTAYLDGSPEAHRIVVYENRARRGSSRSLSVATSWTAEEAGVETLSGKLMSGGRVRGGDPWPSLAAHDIGAAPIGEGAESAIRRAEAAVRRQHSLELLALTGGRYEGRSGTGRYFTLDRRERRVFLLQVPDCGHDIAVATKSASVRDLSGPGTEGVVAVEVSAGGIGEPSVAFLPMPRAENVSLKAGASVGAFTILECSARPTPRGAARPGRGASEVESSVDEALLGLAAIAVGFLIFDALTGSAAPPTTATPRKTWEYGDHSPCPYCGRTRAYVPDRCLCHL